MRKQISIYAKQIKKYKKTSSLALSRQVVQVDIESSTLSGIFCSASTSSGIKYKIRQQINKIAKKNLIRKETTPVPVPIDKQNLSHYGTNTATNEINGEGLIRNELTYIGNLTSFIGLISYDQIKHEYKPASTNYISDILYDNSVTNKEVKNNIEWKKDTLIQYVKLVDKYIKELNDQRNNIQ